MRSRPARRPAPRQARNKTRRASFCRHRPTPAKHLQHVRYLLPLTDVAKVAAMVIDGDSWAESFLEPCQFLLIQYDIVTVGLGVIIRVVAQGVAEDVEAVVGDQRSRGRLGPPLQIVRREDLREIIREWHVAQFALGLF